MNMCHVHNMNFSKKLKNYTAKFDQVFPLMLVNRMKNSELNQDFKKGRKLIYPSTTLKKFAAHFETRRE